MDRLRGSHSQGSPLPRVTVAWDPAQQVSLSLTAGDFRLILHALYILQETEVDPLNRRQRIRLGLIAIHIHDALTRTARNTS